MPATCPSCRAPIAPNDAFCPTCGQVLRTTPSNPHDDQPTQAYRPVQGPRQRASQPRHRQDQHPSPPRTPQPAPHRGRSWFTRKRVLFPLIFLALALASGGGLAWMVNQRLSTFNDVSRPSPDSVPGQALALADQGRGAELGLRSLTDPGGGVTMLLMGADARDGEDIDIGVRPDSLSVLHIGNGACRTLSIPRDTRVLLPGYGGSKINHALAVGGIEYQVLVVEQLLGIEIDHFGLIDFDGMAGVVDAVGGITVTTPNAMSYEDVTVPAGTSTLTGDQALVYARFRDDPEGDFGRQRRQQEIIQAVMRQTNPLEATRALPTIMRDLDGHLKTDLSATSLASFTASFGLSCQGSMESASLDGSVGGDWDDLEGMQLSFVHVPEGEVAQKVRWLTNGSVAFQPDTVAVIAHRSRSDK